MGLQVNIQADAQGNSVLQAFGEVSQNPINDKYTKLLGLDDNTIKNAINANRGHYPNGAWLRDPTSGAVKGDHAYSAYGWEQVSALLRPAAAVAHPMQPGTPRITTQYFDNRSSDTTVKFQGTNKVSDVNTVSSSWSNSETVGLSQSVGYGIEFLGTGAKGSTKMDFSTTLGQGGSETSSVSYESSIGAEINVPPHRMYKLTFSIAKATMDVDVTYDLSLDGTCFYEFRDWYEGHRDWGMWVGSLLDSAGKQRPFRFTETISLDYCTNLTATVEDEQGRALLTMNNMTKAMDGQFDFESLEKNPLILA